MLLVSKQIEKIIQVENIFIEKRKLWFGEFWLFVLWVNFDDITEKFLTKAKDICKEEKALFLQIETLSYSEFEGKNLKNFKKDYYKKFITPNTALIDLTKSEEEIFNEMKPKWRYNIRLAEKKWLIFEDAKKTEENIQIFYDLMQQTTNRDWFFWNNLEYYKTFLNKIDSSKLFFVKKEQKVIAAGIFVFDENIWIYYYWASTSEKEYRNLMAPYLLQWEAVKYAKNAWCKIYDFLWVAGEFEKKSPLAWVTDFKLKLAKRQKVSESFLFVNKKFKYFLIKNLKILKKLVK